MNEIENKFLLIGDKFMPEVHLKQPGFTYRACGPFTRNKERIEKIMQTGNTDFIFRNELDKACFQHDMAYGESKDLAKKTQSDKVLRDKALKIASDPKYDSYQRGLASVVYKFFDKKSASLNLVEVVLTLSQIIISRVKFIGRFIENLSDKKFIHRLETIFGVLI